MDKRTLENQLLEFTGGARLITVPQIMKYSGDSRRVVQHKVRDLHNMGTDSRPKYHISDIATIMCGGSPKKRKDATHEH